MNASVTPMSLPRKLVSIVTIKRAIVLGLQAVENFDSALSRFLNGQIRYMRGVLGHPVRNAVTNLCRAGPSCKSQRQKCLEIEQDGQGSTYQGG